MMNGIVIVLLVFCCTITQLIGQLYTDDVSDGPCGLNRVAHNFTACLPLAVLPNVFTVNIASQAVYRSYAESFLGRPAKDQAELDAMCFSFAFIGAFVIQSGYHDKFNIRIVLPTELDVTALSLNESPLGLGRFKIQPTLAQSRGSTVTNQFVIIDQVVWCDSKHILCVRCVNGTRQDWKVGSIGDPEPWMLPLAKRIVAGLGMPPENAVEYKSVSNGGTCPNPDLSSYLALVLKYLI